MKKLALLLACAALIPASAAFAGGGGRNEADLLGGALFPTTKITLFGEDRLATGGAAVGARLLGGVSPNLSVGGELMSLLAGEHTSNILIPKALTRSKFTSVLFMGEAKFASDRGTLRPFGLVGVGIHSTTMKLDVAPAPGFAWANTGTKESRSIVDSTRMGLALTLQGGFDIPVNDSLRFGLSAAWYHIGYATYDATLLGVQSAPGFMGVKGSISSAALLADASLRF